MPALHISRQMKMRMMIQLNTTPWYLSFFFLTLQNILCIALHTMIAHVRMQNSMDNPPPLCFWCAEYWWYVCIFSGNWRCSRRGGSGEPNAAASQHKGIWFCFWDLTQHAVYCTRHNICTKKNWLANEYLSKTFAVSPSSPIIKSTLAGSSTLEPCAQGLQDQPPFRADPKQVAQNQAQKFAQLAAQTR